jgi:hypothetical protein
MLLGGVGGGLSLDRRTIAEITQCTIVGNSVSDEDPNSGYCIGGGLGLSLCEVNIVNSIVRQNRAGKGDQIGVHAWDGWQFSSDPPIDYSGPTTQLTIHHCNLAGNENDTYVYGDPNLLDLDVDDSNIDADPYFASPGWWDSNGTPEELDDFWGEGDYHLQSQAGRWDNMVKDWVTDDITSPCIDAGDPYGPIGLEPFPNGGYANMGAYALTEEASKSYFGEPPCETIIAGDINGDCHVDFKDLQILVNNWLVPISSSIE